jgi:demethylmenaquinone methyltransferase/2-methoxy-6-polyprenyl-1,4-benzoquinol methylase
MVNDVFTSVAQKYDMMNDAMSLGIHRIWKSAMLDWLAPRNNQHLLDVAGGTGDIAFKFLDRAPLSEVTVLDMTEKMLIEGKKRAEAKRFKDKLNWVCGDALNLPFKDNIFDAYTISFGIRNVTDIPKALSEAYRVLKPGGRMLVLEFSQIPISKLQKLYDLYSFNAIPKMGKLIVGDSDSYKYLVESIRKFPNQEDFLDMLKNAGFENSKYRNLSLGIAALHSGWKI